MFWQNRILNRIRQIAALAGAAILILPIFSCSRSPKKPKVTLAIALLPSEQVGYRKILDDFSKESGVSVDLVAQQYDQIRSVIEAEAQAGKGELDLVELDIYMLPLMSRFMQPLDSLAGPFDQLKKHVPPAAWQAGLLGNPPQILYLPHRLNWQALVYNRSKIPKPPSNWRELLAVAQKYPGSIGFKAAKYEGLICDLFLFIWQAGGDPLHPESPEVVKAFVFLKKLSRFFNPVVQSYKENSILQAEEHDEILLHQNWPFVVPLLREKGLLHHPFETAPLPAGPAGKATILGGGYLGIPETAPHPKMAARLLTYLTSAPVQKRMVAELGWFPIRDEGWMALTGKDKKDFAGFLAMRKFVRARPSVTFYPEVSQIWQDGFYQIIFENQNIATVVKQMQEKINGLRQMPLK